MPMEESAMFKNKLKTSAIALTAVFLVGCTEVLANPNDFENSILDGLVTDLEKNVNSVVYEALRDAGSINQKTLDDVMFLIAEDRLGNYETLLSSTAGEDVALVEKIQRRINEKMYDLIASGQFETRNLFSERRFAFSIEKQLYPLNRTENDPWVEDFIFPPRNSEAIASGEVLEDAIHLEYYQTFIRENLVPRIYRELLVEQYLIEEDYSALGRSYARKVNYVSLKVSTENPESAKYLMDTFIDQYILGEDAAPVADLELLARAWRGVDFSAGAADRDYVFASDSPEFQLLSDAGLLAFDGDTYHPGATYKTLYGEILSRFEKIIPENPLLTDKSIENEFTGNGQYTPETGLEIKRNELFKRDFTTDGWHIKNGGLGSLPSAIRDRVFNIGVANAIDRIDDEADDVASPRTSDFIRKINGVSYLIPQTSQQNDTRNFLLYDANTTTYYIVQVLEAVNTTKMNASSTSTTNYDALENDNGVKRNLIAGEIAKILGAREANINASNLHWLKLAEISFHDQTIYDFFKERFPTIYDEDETND
jgi:hypothetical protein